MSAGTADTNNAEIPPRPIDSAGTTTSISDPINSVETTDSSSIFSRSADNQSSVHTTDEDDDVCCYH